MKIISRSEWTNLDSESRTASGTATAWTLYYASQIIFLNMTCIIRIKHNIYCLLPHNRQCNISLNSAQTTQMQVVAMHSYGFPVQCKLLLLHLHAVNQR